MRGRPLVLTFKLFTSQWNNFLNFYEKNRKGILTKEFINKEIKEFNMNLRNIILYYLQKLKMMINNIKEEEKAFGHVVIIVEYNEDGYVCLNSWGKNFADKGQFRIKNLDVLLSPFIIDVYFNIIDLPLELKNAWNEYNKKNEEQFKDKYFE